jgi:hypothetical protein
MSDPTINARIEESIRARGPEYQRLVEQRREHERVRKREARERRQRSSENMNASESGKPAFGKRPNSANVKKSGKEGATAQS